MSMPKRLLLVAFALAASLFAAGPAAAQTASPEQTAAAKELVTAMRASEQLKTMFPLIMNALRPAIVQNRPEIARDFDALMPGLLREVEAQSEGFVAAIAAVYARNFTVGQMRDIAAFYKTPTGQALLEKQPVLGQESLAIGQRFAQSLAGDFQKQIRDELRKKGHNI
jgi:hypothetical protein